MQDDRLLRQFIREMAHYAPVKSKTIRDFPHLSKVGQQSLEESLLTAADACDALGDKTFLERRHKIQTSGGIIRVTSEDWHRGRIGLALSYDSDFKEFLETLTKRLGMKNMVFASHGGGRFGNMDQTFGDSHVFVPLGSYETWWNPEVSDVKIDTGTMSHSEAMKLIDGYTSGWPDQPVDEVLVDCNEYILIDLARIAKTYGYTVSSYIDRGTELPAEKPGKKTDLLVVKTYSELSPYLRWLSSAMTKLDA